MTLSGLSSVIAASLSTIGGSLNTASFAALAFILLPAVDIYGQLFWLGVSNTSLWSKRESVSGLYFLITSPANYNQSA